MDKHLQTILQHQLTHALIEKGKEGHSNVVKTSALSNQWNLNSVHKVCIEIFQWKMCGVHSLTQQEQFTAHTQNHDFVHVHSIFAHV